MLLFFVVTKINIFLENGTPIIKERSVFIFAIVGYLAVKPVC